MAADTAKQEALDAAKMEADAALKLVQGALDEAEDDVADIRRDLADELAAAALKEKIAREAAIKTAIGANRAGTAANPLPNAMSLATEVAAKRNAASMVTVDVNTAATDDVYTGGETTASSDDWNSVTMTRTDAEEAEDTLVIYTDIDAPADVDIETVYTVNNDQSVGRRPYFYGH